MLSNKKQRRGKKGGSFRYELDGLTIEFNFTINIYNDNENDNDNNLANQGGKAGISMTANDSAQISGDRGSNALRQKQMPAQNAQAEQTAEGGQTANPAGKTNLFTERTEIDNNDFDDDFFFEPIRVNPTDDLDN